jgi:hypothetical protein
MKLKAAVSVLAVMETVFPQGSLGDFWNWTTATTSAILSPTFNGGLQITPAARQPKSIYPMSCQASISRGKENLMNRRLLSIGLTALFLMLVLVPAALAQTVPPTPPEIPEAGSLLMLGTGLAGLAGYVGLRWRARK